MNILKLYAKPLLLRRYKKHQI